MSETITLKAADGHGFPAYIARPSGQAKGGIVVLQEIFGVNAVMREVCDELAAQGYVALCPDLFWRQEPGIQITDKTDAEWKRAFELFQGFDINTGMMDVSHAIDALRRHDACTGKVGTVGYCLGGRLAYLAATRTTTDASVGYYGVYIQDHLDEARNIKNPLMLHVAEADEFVPPEAQAKIKEGLAGNPLVTVHSYAGRDHAFARVGGKHYDAAAAKLANDRTAAFFKQHLG